jgi:hypothetical protein
VVSTLSNSTLFYYNSAFLWILQSAVSLQDFQEAEPDVLAHSTPAILEHFSEKGSRCNIALKALCKKKGLHVEVNKCFRVLSLYISGFLYQILCKLYAACLFAMIYRTHFLFTWMC